MDLLLLDIFFHEGALVSSGANGFLQAQMDFLRHTWFPELDRSSTPTPVFISKGSSCSEDGASRLNFWANEDDPGGGRGCLGDLISRLVWLVLRLVSRYLDRPRPTVDWSDETAVRAPVGLVEQMKSLTGRGGC